MTSSYRPSEIQCRSTRSSAAMDEEMLVWPAATARVAPMYIVHSTFNLVLLVKANLTNTDAADPCYPSLSYLPYHD